MSKWNHALTLAFEVISDHERMPTFEEARSALLRRVADLLVDEGEARGALMSELPFDTFEVSE